MVGRLGTAREGLDDEHTAAAAWTGTRVCTRLARLRDFGLLGLAHGRRHCEQLTSACDVGGASAIGEQPIMADAVEALGQHVNEEAPDELVSCEPRAHPCPCPCCVGRMLIIETFPRGSQPAHHPTPVPPTIRIDTS